MQAIIEGPPAIQIELLAAGHMRRPGGQKWPVGPTAGHFDAAAPAVGTGGGLHF